MSYIANHKICYTYLTLQTIRFVIHILHCKPKDLLYISYIAKHLITALLPKLTVIHKNGNAQSPPGSFLLPQSVTIYIQIWVAKLLAIVTPLKQLCEQMFDTKAHLMPFRVLYYWLKMILGIS